MATRKLANESPGTCLVGPFPGVSMASYRWVFRPGPLACKAMVMTCKAMVMTGKARVLTCNGSGPGVGARLEAKGSTFLHACLSKARGAASKRLGAGR